MLKLCFQLVQHLTILLKICKHIFCRNWILKSSKSTGKQKYGYGKRNNFRGKDTHFSKLVSLNPLWRDFDRSSQVEFDFTFPFPKERWGDKMDMLPITVSSAAWQGLWSCIQTEPEKPHLFCLGGLLQRGANDSWSKYMPLHHGQIPLCHTLQLL